MSDFTFPPDPAPAGVGGYGIRAASDAYPGTKRGVPGGPLGSALTMPLGGVGNWRIYEMPTSDTSTREIALSVAPVTRPNRSVTILAELRDRFLASQPWNGDDVLIRVYTLDPGTGAPTELLVPTYQVMATVSATVRSFTFTPDSEGTYVIEVQGSYDDLDPEPAGPATPVGIVRTQAMLVESALGGGFDPIATILGVTLR